MHLKVMNMSNLGNKQIFANNLSRLMQEKQIDRQKLCDDLNLKYSTVSEWLSAKKYPRIDKIELMANYFGVQKSDLIENFLDKKNADNTPATDDDIKFALFNSKDGITDEMLDEVKEFAKFVKSKYKK